MKICIIGLGSIGRRHLKNLDVLLKSRDIEYQIDSLRSSRKELEDACKRLISKQYYDINDMPSDYDVIFVTNPTAMHYDTIKKTLKKTQHMFIEKPVFESIKYDVGSLPLKNTGIYYVACPLRHKNIMKYVKNEVLVKDKIVSARIISTSYLPDWRVNVDYRATYSSKQSMGGGVTKDLIHEWDYAVYFFGVPDKVMHINGHVSNLEIDTDDVSVYIAKYKEMILEVHLDYIGHKEERILQLFTNEKRIDVDLILDTIYEYRSNKLVNKREFLKEDFYENELGYFFDCIENKQKNFNTIKDAYNILKIALIEE